MIIDAGEMALQEPECVGAIGRVQILEMGGDEGFGLLGGERGVEVAVDRYLCSGGLLAQVPVEGGEEEVGVDECGGGGVRAVLLVGADIVGGGAPVFRGRVEASRGRVVKQRGGRGRRGR